MPMSTSQKVLRYRWLIFGVMALTYLSAFFHRVCPAVVAVDIQESFGISAGLVGLLASTYFYSYAAIQFPAGLLSDTLGPRKSVTVFVLLAAVGSILFGLSPTLEIALLGRVLVGFGAGMAFTPTMKILSGWFRVTEFTRMNGILLSVGGLGALTAAAPLAFITGLVGWRTTFELIGFGTLVLAGLVWLVVRNTPGDMGWPSLEEIDPVYGKTLGPSRRIPLWEGVRQVLSEKYFWAAAFWSVFSMGVFFSFGGLWAGPYLIHVYGMSKAEAGGVLNMLSVGILVGSPIMAYLSERVFRSRKKVLIASSGLLTLVLLFLNLFPQGLPRPALYLLFLLMSATALAPGVVSITIVKELFPVEITGTSVGTVNLFPFVGGGVLQLVAGLLLDSYPQTASGAYPIEAYSRILLVFLGGGLIAFLCTFLMKETYPHRHGSRRG
ncbi:MAG: MFS transporter [Desulfomonilaceae bacterium]|nr:MFS transporter [Desulfomonilaceae bacterium]